MQVRWKVVWSSYLRLWEARFSSSLPLALVLYFFKAIKLWVYVAFYLLKWRKSQKLRTWKIMQQYALLRFKSSIWKFDSHLHLKEKHMWLTHSLARRLVTLKHRGCVFLITPQIYGNVVLILTETVPCGWGPPLLLNVMGLSVVNSMFFPTQITLF